MKKELLIGGLLLIVVIVVANMAWSSYQGSMRQSSNVSSPSNTTVTGYTLAQIQQHQTPTDCWLLIHNKVYNVTSYINEHPGGSMAIVTWCGKEASQAFDTQGGNGQHSRQAEQMLQSFYIGDYTS